MRQLSNARILQREDLKYELVYEDEDGATQTAGPFETGNDAAGELDKLRASEPAATAADPPEPLQAGAIDGGPQTAPEGPQDGA